MVSLVCGTLLIYLCFLFARRFFGDARKAIWIAFLVAFQPYLVRYSGQVLSESFTVLVFTLAAFAFYVGWQENRRTMIALSGTCLLLAYLARPEYLVYFAPFVLFLLPRRRIVDICIFLLPLCIVGLAYVLYLHSQTGLWIVSRKATLSPIVPFSSFFVNLPYVVYHLGNAIFPPFLLLAGFGFMRVERRFRYLVIALILFHVFSLSLVGHTTKRYSVEFIPLCLFFAVEGVSVVSGLMRRFSRKYLGTCLIAAVIVLSGLLESHVPARPDRKLQKDAGLYLRAIDPGSVIAARLPIIAFYGDGKWVGLRQHLNGDDVDQLDRIISGNHVKYIATDEQIELLMPAVRQYVSRIPLLKELKDREYFVRIYRTNSKAE